MKFRYANTIPCQYAILLNGEQLIKFNHLNDILLQCYIFTDKGAMITTSPYDHLTFAISNQTPISIILDFANFITDTNPNYWTESIPLRKHTHQTPKHFLLETNLSNQRYPTNDIHIIIPPRLM